MGGVPGVSPFGGLRVRLPAANLRTRRVRGVWPLGVLGVFEGCGIWEREMRGMRRMGIMGWRGAWDREGGWGSRGRREGREGKADCGIRWMNLDG